MLTRLQEKLFPQLPNPREGEFEFLGQFNVEKDSLNGLQFRDVYIPEEVILNIFTYLSPHDILACSLVCKNWYNIAKCNALWQRIYNEKEYPKKAPSLPWYVFYCYFSTNNFKNLIRNGNGEEKFKHWKIVVNGGNKFKVEETPQGSDPLPENVPEFHGHTSCFVTSYSDCFKFQKIDLKPKRLLRYIIKKYKPTLYASEWYAGRFDCSCYFQLTVACSNSDNEWNPQEPSRSRPRHFIRLGQNIDANVILPPPTHFKSVRGQVEQWEGKAWKKLEIFYDDYPSNVEAVNFCHEGRDLQFWAGHYGSKMAGGVLRFLFETLKPTSEDVLEKEDLRNN